MTTTPNALLAIETSTPVARVGVFDVETGAARARASAESTRHSSNLLRLCVEVTAEAGVTIAELAAIACGAGPGSFTGLRVGYAVAKGLAMPFGLPFLSVSSPQALAWDMAPLAEAGEWLLPCLDAGKGQIYVAPFAVEGGGSVGVGGVVGGGDDGGDGGGGAGRKEGGPRSVARQGDDLVVAPSAVGDATGAAAGLGGGARSWLLAGPGATRYREALGAALGARARFVDVPGPSAEAVACFALERLARRQVEDLATAVPAYGRAPDITRAKRT